MSLSDRERVEGFHHTITRAVKTISTAVAATAPTRILTLMSLCGRFEDTLDRLGLVTETHNIRFQIGCERQFDVRSTDGQTSRRSGRMPLG